MKLCICAAISMCLLPGIFSVAAVQPRGAVLSMKLLTPEVGWATDARNLLWTADGGSQWKDITPHKVAQRRIGGVFFLNTTTGWVLLSHSDEKSEQQFEIAFTANSGGTWSASPVNLPWPRYPEDFSGGGNIYFIDRLHGWTMLEILSATLSPGRLLFTQDGGKTWEPTRDDPGRSGSLCFFNKGDGILTGGLLGTELWLTHDGSNAWKQVSLPPPSQVGPNTFPTYGSPACKDGKHGFLPVTYTPTVYSNHESFSTALVLFATDDAGRRWRVDTVLSALPDVSHGSAVPSTVAGSNLVAGVKSQEKTTLYAVGPHDLKSEARSATLGRISKLSFVDALQGWALTDEGLFSTSDAGVSWRQITIPSYAVSVEKPHNNSPLPSAAKLSRPPQSNEPVPPSGQGTEARLGFDRGLVPSTGDMLAWWDYSPYFEYQISLPGAANHKTDGGLTSQWTTAVQNYGWGLWPVWVGPQAPCVNQKKVVKIKTNKDAYKQGQAEATSAISALEKLSAGFAGTIIYYDMENYNTSDSGCRKIVRTFLNGWVNGLKASGFKTGVYGNVAPAALDFSKVAPLPDFVWITWGPGNNVSPNIPDVSIWGLKPKKGPHLCDPFTDKTCNPFLWSKGQRIHQYIVDNPNNPYTETWGQVQLEIDPDIVDAMVASPSTQAKNTYTFDFTSIDYPNAKLTNALGLNDIGQVVGYWYFVSSSPFGFVAQPPYGVNNFTMLEYPNNSVRTVATGINSAGQIAGYYVDSNANFYGFTVSPPYGDQDYSQPISLGNGVLTIAEGINDDGQVVGYYEDSNGFHGFLYNTMNGVITNPIDNGGSSVLRGVNGDAVILGIKQGSTSFLYDAVTGGIFSLGFTVFGVNSSLEMVGEDTLYDYPTGSQITIGMPNGAVSAGAFGINDYSDIAGSWSDSNSVQHGFIASPKQQ